MVCLLVCSALFVSISGWAQSGGDIGKEIIVRKKDTLWSIAYREYSDGLMWRKIYQFNSDRIKNPDLIFPGDKIILPEKYKQYPFETKNVISSSTDEVYFRPADSLLHSLTVVESGKDLTQEDINKSDVEILKEPILSEEMPESQVFSSFTNKTILVDKKYFNGEVKKIIKDDDIEAAGLSQNGDELLLKVWGDRINIGSIAEIYTKIKEEGGKVTAQICGRCEIFYVEYSLVRCRLVWVNNIISHNMPVRVN